MDKIIKDILSQEIAALTEQLSLLEKRAAELRDTLTELTTLVETVDEPSPKVDEPSLTVDEPSPTVDEPSPTEQLTPNTPEENEEMLNEEELFEEDTIEDDIISEFEEEEVEEEFEEEEIDNETEEEIVEEEIDNDESSSPQEPTEKPIGITLPRIDDIRRAMSLGDRFLFQRELFSGDGEKMNKTIDKLNSLTSMEEALEYIAKKFQWDKESQAYELFTNILKRRY